MRENHSEEHQVLIGKHLADAFDDVDTQAEEFAEQPRDGGVAVPIPNFIQMRDVTIGHGSDAEIATVSLWRGQVKSIDDWSLGSR